MWYRSSDRSSSVLRLNLNVHNGRVESPSDPQVIGIRIRGEHWDANQNQLFERSAKGHLDFRRLRDVESSPREYGELLAEAIFGPTGISEFYLDAVKSAAPAALHVILHLEDEESLGRCRWEWLRGPASPEGHSLFLARDSRVTFSVHIGSDVAYERRIREDELRSLVVSGCPIDMDQTSFKPFDPEKAASAIPDAWPVAITRWFPYPRQRFFASEKLVSTSTSPEDLWNGLIKRLREQQYATLHLICHGQRVDEDLGLILCDAENRFQLVRGSQLVDQLKQLQRSPGLPLLIVLAVCESGHGDVSVGGLAQQLIEECGIPAVIAMRGPVSVEAAEKVSSRFYKELAKNGSVPSALSRSLRGVGTDAAELSIVLFSRSAQQSLLDYTSRGLVTPRRVYQSIGLVAVFCFAYWAFAARTSSQRFATITDPAKWAMAPQTIDQAGTLLRRWLTPRLDQAIVAARTHEHSHTGPNPNPNSLTQPVYQGVVATLALAQFGETEPLLEVLADTTNPTLRNQTINLIPEWFSDRPDLLVSLLERSASNRVDQIAKLKLSEEGSGNVFEFRPELNSVHLQQYGVLLAMDAVASKTLKTDDSLVQRLCKQKLEGFALSSWLELVEAHHIDPGVHAASQTLIKTLRNANVFKPDPVQAGYPKSLSLEQQNPRVRERQSLRSTFNHYRQWSEIKLSPRVLDVGTQDTLTFVYFPAQQPAEWFWMGSDASDDRIDLHRHRLEYGFLLCADELSVNAFRALSGIELKEHDRHLGYKPDSPTRCAYSPFIGRVPDWLVEVQQVCNQLGAETSVPPFWKAVSLASESGKYNYCEPTGTHVGFRLPTEAEWEFAARCGSTEASFIGFFLDGVPGPTRAENRFIARGTVLQPVMRSKWPSPYGLFDIHGNLAEICLGNQRMKKPRGDQREGVYVESKAASVEEDLIGNDRIVVRGGDFLAQKCFPYSWHRYWATGMPTTDRRRDVYFGFRLSRIAMQDDFD